MMSRPKKLNFVSFWTFVIAAVFAAVCLVHINTSRAKQADKTSGHSQVTVERIPAVEARRMGVESRNN
jgi:hypothetical protein